MTAPPSLGASPASRGEKPSPPRRGRGDLSKELAHRLRQQELLALFGLFVADRLDLDDLLREGCRVAADGLGAQLAKIMEWVRVGDYLLMRAGVGWDPELVNWATVSADPSTPAGHALATNAPVVSAAGGTDEQLSLAALLGRSDVMKSISVLIATSSGHFGVLEVDCTCDCEFSRHDVNFVSSVAHLLGAAITRRDADAALRANQVALEAANATLTLLGMEIHHRVKNGLQLIASLLSMQGRASKITEVRNALVDAEMRVIAVARVYDHLSEAVDAPMVDLSAFLSELCVSLLASAPKHRLTFQCAEALPASSERAIYIGLIVNELVTNAVKYAYPDGGGEIVVRVRSESGGGLQLEVIDHGVGLPANGAASERVGLGAQLSEMLTALLGGKLQLTPADPGLRCHFRIGLDKPGAAA
ncbi:MAG: sensor histidine kinase [Elsteraceae bacterium]